MCDAIITCGDEFTAGGMGPNNLIQDSWPKIVAKHFDVPYENLAWGQSSNYEIALQPIVYQQKSYKNPLYIFSFTDHYRYPFFHPGELKISGITTVDKEYWEHHDWARSHAGA